VTRRRLLRNLWVAAGAGAGQGLGRLPQKEGGMTQAELHIERFRRGERFQPPARAFLTGGGVPQEELNVLAYALRTESAPVREEIVRLLADAGYRSDPLFASGGQVIRHPGIIYVLVEYGLAQPDPGRDAALETLQTYVPPDLLAPYGPQLTGDLERTPDSTAFLVIAKGKPPVAVPVVRKLLLMPRWAKQQEARVAAAALGDKGIEKDFVEMFLGAQEAKEKAKLARVLGWIGTEDALRALAGQMRTDLIFEVPRAFRRSVRLDIMAALGYNFPALTFLYENSIRNDQDYARVEQFCEQRFQVQWDRPRPPYLKIQGYPIPAPAR